jgi:hypothetical protein
LTYAGPLLGEILLVGGLEPWNFMTLKKVGNGITIPTDELIFFRGVETTNQVA